MLRIVDCLTMDHEWSLVLLAAVLCLMGCTACIVVASRATCGARSYLWVSLLSVCVACTAWSTHFIAMLAYKVDVPITYASDMTALSLIMGMMIISAGVLVAYSGRNNKQLRLLGGVVVGTGVAVLHYIGMSGLRFPGTLNYDADLVIASLIAAWALGGAALNSMFGAQGYKSGLPAGILLLLMIVLLHFTGMGATTLELGFFEASEGISRTVLIVGVTLSSIIVLIIGAAAALFDERLDAQRTRQAERFKTLADGAFEGLIVHENLLILDSNLAGRTMLGLKGDGTGRLLSDWSIRQSVKLNLGDNAVIEEIIVSNGDDVHFPAEVCRRGILLENGQLGEMIAIRDLTQRKEQEARIRYIAEHDALTDLPNRQLFETLAKSSLLQAKRNRSAFAILSMDLDHFKAINDMYGHAVGDGLIRIVAQRVSNGLGEGDVIARQGGDEFCILSASDNQPQQVIELAREIHEALGEKIVVEGIQLAIGASIGIAIYPADGTTIEKLVINADTAMYEAKANGKASTCFFESRMNIELHKRRQLESGLRLALENNALTLNYQPLITCSDRRVVCFEALLRWKDDELGFISPEEFIPIAEQTGLILPIGEFVLNQACKDASSWDKSISVAVNLSVAQFSQHDLVGVVRQALRSSGLSGDRLELEITESLLMDDNQEALDILDELKSMGIRIAMDDFGTGYSSLCYLQSFKFDKLKIDRAFVSHLDTNPTDASIVDAVVSIGKTLRMKVVAEGVETEPQAQILTRLNCDELQGYHIAKPMSAPDVQVFLSEKKASDGGEQQAA